MRHLIALIAATAVLTTSTAMAQHYSHDFSYSRLHGHGDRYCHVPDIHRFDRYVHELATACRHLHEDAHQLSQDYPHSRSIERYIERLDRLKMHMEREVDESLARYHGFPDSLQRHMKNDLRDVKSLASRFYRHLEHQALDGVRACDVGLLTHMQELVLHEVFPLICQLEIELYGSQQSGGYPSDFIRGSSHYHAPRHYETRREEIVVPSRSVPVPNIPPLARQMMAERGFPLPPMPSRRGGISIGGLRIQF